MKITASHFQPNEHGARYIAYLQEREEIEVLLESLEAGDIAIDTLGIERKRVDDLFMTLNEGRLFNQLLQLKLAYSRSLLLIEGKGMRYHLDNEPWFGFYLRIAAGWQIPILHTHDAEQTASCIYRICHQDAVAPAGTIRPRPRNPAYGEDSIALRILRQIPSIGPQQAGALLEEFETLTGVFSASQKELLKVAGIGLHRAKAIMAANGGH